VLEINGLNGAFKSFGELHNKPCGALQYVGALAFALGGVLKLSAPGRLAGPCSLVLIESLLLCSRWTRSRTRWRAC